MASATNWLEGGVNAEIKRVLNSHRGLGEEHMRRCCEWVVYMRSANPDPESFVIPDCWTGTPGPGDAVCDDGTGAGHADRRTAVRARRRRLRERVRHQERLGRTTMTHPTHPDKTHISLLNPGLWPIGTFVVLITVARPCGSRRVGLSFLSCGK